MTEEHDYSNERVVGHHVHASVEQSRSAEWADEMELDIEPRTREFVRIVEGDVDWDETREVRLTHTELRQIANECSDQPWEAHVLDHLVEASALLDDHGKDQLAYEAARLYQTVGARILGDDE